MRYVLLLPIADCRFPKPQIYALLTPYENCYKCVLAYHLIIQLKRTNSWKASIREHRRRLRNDFKVSPSLKRYFGEIFDECYQDSRELSR